MELGTLIRQLQRESNAGTAIDTLGDIVLFNRVARMAETYGESSAEYVSASVGRFAAAASDESWLSLLTAIERADDPGRAALSVMLQWALASDAAETTQAGCSCSGGGGAPVS